MRVVDLRPLRAPGPFRLLLASGLITAIGSMVTYVAIPFQVAELTGSYLAVGVLGVVELIPIVVFGLYGGALADRVDRRRMVLWTEAGAGAIALVLFGNSLLPRPNVVVIAIAAFAFAAVDSLQRPSLDAMTPRIVARDHLAAAGTLLSAKGTIASIAGPAIGGLLLTAGGASAAYAADAVTFVISLMILVRLPSVRVAEPVARALHGLAQGVAYLRRRPDIQGTYFIDLIAMAFAFPLALYPFWAADLAAPWALGLLYSAGAVGGLAVTATGGWMSRVQRPGRAIVLAALAWGAAIAAAGLSSSLWLSVAFLALAGAADMTSGVFRTLIWNLTIPDALRGRMAGLELLSYSAGPLIGQLRSTGMAQVIGLRRSIVAGGLMCCIGVGAASTAMPALWRFDSAAEPRPCES